jgi:hypothetical protein
VFLEDYDDRRDDEKYYRGDMLYDRKKDYETEREADIKDRCVEFFFVGFFSLL